MEVNIEIRDESRDLYDVAEVEISIPEINRTALLDIDLRTIYEKFGKPNNKALDFLTTSSIIYAIDRLIPRKLAEDNWTRLIEVEIPVIEHDDWENNGLIFNEVINYLTGDIWEISYRKAEKSIFRPPKDQPNLDQENKFDDPNIKVSLFSGGLDSLIGAINLLENHSSPIQLIGHYDGDIGGVRQPQQNLFSEIETLYPDRSNLQQIRLGIVKSSVTNDDLKLELSTRSRSIIFISLGIYAAEAIGDNTNLFIPENGFISINIPFSPSRRGSCSTRTTHPFVISNLNRFLQRMSINQSIDNPYRLSTKGEMISDCQNFANLKNLYETSISCSKSNRKMHWNRTDANQCGVCLPCIIRRSSLYANGLDTETYGCDFCSSSLDPNAKKGLYADLRDLLHFFKEGHNNKEKIGALIVNNSAGIIQDIDTYKNLVSRGLSEIEDILTNKANRI